VLPNDTDVNRIARVFVTAMNKNPKLIDCDATSIWQSMLDCCSLGLEPDALGRAYFVPFKGKCQLQIGYKGLVDLAMRSGKVASFHSDKVCENDDFNYVQGSEFILTHKPCLKGPRGEAYAYYAYCKMKDGGFNADVMTIEEVNRIKSRSQSGGSSFSPWATDYDEMAKKTVVKRLSKMLPLSPQFMDAVMHDNAVNPVDENEEIKDVPFTIPSAPGQEILTDAEMLALDGTTEDEA
jgi:recombination protein RecT